MLINKLKNIIKENYIFIRNSNIYLKINLILTILNGILTIYMIFSYISK